MFSSRVVLIKYRFIEKTCASYIITSSLFSANAAFRLPDEDILSSAQAHTWSRSVTEDCRICCHLFIWAWWNCLWSCRTCAHSPAVCGRGLHRETVQNQHAEKQHVCVCVCVCVCAATQLDHTCQLKSTSARSPVCVRPVPAPRVCRTASCSEPPEQPDWIKNREEISILRSVLDGAISMVKKNKSVRFSWSSKTEALPDTDPICRRKRGKQEEWEREYQQGVISMQKKEETEKVTLLISWCYVKRGVMLLCTGKRKYVKRDSLLIFLISYTQSHVVLIFFFSGT